MIDIFKNYQLQREELLARIAEKLQLDETSRVRMESAYNSIGKLLNEDEGFFKKLELDVYPQGSVAIGTTVKPYKGNEFDLDIVLHLKHLYTNFSPHYVYNELVRVLKNDNRYSDKVELKRRCVRLNYSGDFHMDIMPGCIVIFFDDKKIKVPDRDLKDWVSSNPKGFAEWFLTKSKLANKPLLGNYYMSIKDLKAEIQDLPNENFYLKTPLQRAVQLTKRYRDIYFEKNREFATSSIVLTTLMGQLYNGENSIYDTIENIITKINEQISGSIAAQQRFKVFNPVNEEEEFTDKWTSSHYSYFFSFIKDFHLKWEVLKQNFDKSGNDYVKLFGEGIYQQTLQDQIKAMSKFSEDKKAIANGLILGGIAYTNSQGQISNSNTGQKNERHSNFGG